MTRKIDIENDVLRILREAGNEGLSVKKISRHVFNQHHTMFDDLSYEMIHASVYSYLHRKAASKKSFVEHAEKRGTYRISNHGAKIVQLTIDF